ncbi:MAG TPA: hypothetical protein VHZ24_18525 [Pirellulales bacterium]|nr:hypothetical protein [Pirellulales bacterium]
MPSSNPAPNTLTGVPPVSGPEDGETLVSAGPYTNPSVGLAVEPSGLRTTGTTSPAVCAGAAQVSTAPSGLTDTVVAARPSNATVAAGSKPEPTNVTSVPPVTPPACGVIPVMDGMRSPPATREQQRDQPPPPHGTVA